MKLCHRDKRGTGLGLSAATQDARAPRAVFKGGPAVNVSVGGAGNKDGIEDCMVSCALPTAAACTGAIYIPEIGRTWTRVEYSAG